MESFPIAPATSKVLWFLPFMVVILIIPLVVTVVTVLGAGSSSAEVSAAGLRLRGDFYGRLIPVDQIRAADARRVDIDREPGLKPTRRTLGTGLPGYQSGWFRLANGEKALLYLTDRSRAVYVPTSAGYAVLVSPQDPDAFVAAVHSLAR